MTVAIKSLDDLGYDRLLADVVARIPGIDGEWTDHSPTEPGIVLLELFCWLTDMAIWRLDQVSPEVIGAMLALLDPPDPRSQSPAAPRADVDAALARLRDKWRAPYRAVTEDDFRRLLADQWRDRRFTVRSTAGSGRVNVFVEPATQHLVTSLRLAPGQWARVFPVERPGIVQIDVSSPAGTIESLIERASEADIASGLAWILLDSPTHDDRRTLTLLGPDGQVRAETDVGGESDESSLSIVVAGQTVLDSEPLGVALAAGAARCSLLRPACEPSSALSFVLWAWAPIRDVLITDRAGLSKLDISRLTLLGPGFYSYPANTPVNVRMDMTLDRHVDLGVSLEQQEATPGIVAEITEFLRPRKLLGTRLDIQQAVPVPISVKATLYLEDAADPGATFGRALARLILHIKGTRSRPRELVGARLVASLAGTEGVQYVDLPSQGEPASPDPNAGERPRHPSGQTIWTPGQLDVVLESEELAELGQLELSIMQRDQSGSWKEV